MSRTIERRNPSTQEREICERERERERERKRERVKERRETPILIGFSGKTTRYCYKQ